MTDDEIVERVARAVWGYPFGIRWDETSDKMRDVYLDRARAAIAAHKAALDAAGFVIVSRECPDRWATFNTPIWDDITLSDLCSAWPDTYNTIHPKNVTERIWDILISAAEHKP